MALAINITKYQCANVKLITYITQSIQSHIFNINNVNCPWYAKQSAVKNEMVLMI